MECEVSNYKDLLRSSRPIMLFELHMQLELYAICWALDLERWEVVGDACRKNQNLTLKGDEFEWLRRGELLEKQNKRIYSKVLKSEGPLLYHMLPKANEISDHVLHGSAPQPRLIRMQWSMSTFTARLIFSHVQL